MNNQSNPVMNNSKQSPRRRRLPKYYRSAYKIFFEEKRAEIINTRLRAYDESAEKPKSLVPVHSNISLPRLTIEINQMWKAMSSPDRDRYKARARLDVKRQRVAKADLKHKTDNLERDLRSQNIATGQESSFASFGTSSPTYGIFDTLEAIADDRFYDSAMKFASIDLDVNIAPDPLDLKCDLSVLDSYEMQSNKPSASTDTRSDLTQTSVYSGCSTQQPPQVVPSSPCAFFGETFSAIHTMAPLSLHHPQRGCVTVNDQNSSFLFAVPSAPVAVATMSALSPGNRLHPSSCNIYYGPTSIYPTSTLPLSAAPYVVVDVAQTHAKGPLASYYSHHGCYHPKSHPPYLQSIYPMPMTYYSTGGDIVQRPSVPDTSRVESMNKTASALLFPVLNEEPNAFD